ncbi:MAG: AAC(3)-I family aminoglycoside N-acetyltransferase [Deltaproteobacteria bacterium]|nr:AAC(3)-I family aminoglycoside N-acetyltransferase [Deltaproteobacteria bacterium]
MPARVCRLGPEDVAVMRAVNALFAKVFDDHDHYAAKPPSDAYLTRLLGKPECVVLAAVVGSEVVGALVGYELQKLEQERSEFYIYDLAVDERFRRQGVATALINEIRAVAAERGGWVVYVQADYGDEPAVALYTKLGVREDVMHFDIKVGSE